jgi:hypothetical protein
VPVRGADCCTQRLHETCRRDPQSRYSACMRAISVESVAAAVAPLLAAALHEPLSRKELHDQVA